MNVGRMVHGGLGKVVALGAPAQFSAVFMH